ncbi:hypothetical protein P175DRAFT_0497914 [Aspergillus ochraceoroseus IBT 24754]|uniref:Arf-GAP domain-containing protein n=3 Tax=Aspergillus subgen. Nidulantes TaxID=2720870 RepID=A0A0F8VTL1_9EURO|nr:uncharacterized protein P175DRAFT_0497914 [Aspergillus ochraceoroseus IBT 24754]KKK24383.1 hypothetical protein AOCH_001459 [Aspergillus ochraceoroseus]KKK26556.1 hypothetical protein ARAM_002967 [Aspergillus rambellii]PTU24810.1 hypothetical protein P175DRAFT_0497914 [Aspergillus ochraceoroseus IBT 24754]
MSRLWEVDPETKAKLLQYSKVNGNDRCCDCGAPSPQWASPKFGTFICLNCAGTHRGLGVHISFVRSITMDAFKNSETHRMELGGNDPWKEFFDSHPITQSEGRTFEDSTIKERYEGEVGEEWKERLSAKVEGREYVPGHQQSTRQKKPAVELGLARSGSRSSTPGMGAGFQGGRGSPAAAASLQEGPGGVEGAGGRKVRNEAYFAKLGSENSTRSESLPPSQGGKFTGFGGGLPPSMATGRSAQQSSGNGAIPGFDDFQKDPMAALTKGFGWFTTAVGKGAKTMNESYIQPTAKSIAESDFAAQARVHASQLGQNIQVGARGAADSFQRFVEGPENSGAGRGSRNVEPEHKDFWDDFSTIGSQENQRMNAPRSGAIGTAAMKPSPTGTAATTTTGVSGSDGTPPPASKKSQEDGGGWDDNW